MLRDLWYALPFTGEETPLVTLVRLEGMIATDSAGRKNLNLDKVEDALDEAFENDRARAVVIGINSPGGSPAQSRMIHDRIRALAEKHRKPVITHIEDVGASGGYVLACAGDEIYADPFAIVGSIGVIAGGFGMQDAIARLGVERRVYTAGDNKSQLDPFVEEDPQDVERLEDLLKKSHRIFIDLVKDRRGTRLIGAHDDMFSGQFWIAADAAGYGLVDKVEDRDAMLRRRFGGEVAVKKIEVEKKSFLSQLLSSSLGAVLSPEAVLAGLRAETLWARFGQR